MAKMKKPEVIAALKEIEGLEFDEKANYNDLCKLLKDNGEPDPEAPETKTPKSKKPRQVKIVNRISKRNTFLGDSVRDERDALFLNTEIKQRKYKGKIRRVTTIKDYEVSKDGFWVTEFIIDLKE